MCAGCLQHLEALVICGAGAAVVATNAREARADRKAGISPAERSLRTWLRNRAFMEELGLDPSEVLGPAPTLPAPRGAPRPATRPVVAPACEADQAEALAPDEPRSGVLSAAVLVPPAPG